MPTIFSRIIAGEIPAEIVFKNEYVTAFRDIHPIAPVHVLIVPNKEIPTVNDAAEEDAVALGHLFLAAKQIAQDQGIAQDGYRLIVNCNEHGGQEVFHVHMHMVGGRRLGPMLAK